MSDTATASTAASGTPDTGASSGTQGASAGVQIGDTQFNFLDSALPKGWAAKAGVPDSFEAKFTSLKAALGSHANLEKAWGNPNKVVIPGADAKPEEVAAFRKAYGVPDKPDGYALAKPEKMKIGDKEIAIPDSLWDKGTVDRFAAMAHAAGFTPAQVQAAIQFDLERNVTGSQQIEQQTQQAFEQGQALLKKEWGANFDANIKAAQVGAKAIGGEELFNHPLVQNDPVLLKAFAKVGGMVSERPAVGARVGSDNGQAADPRGEARRLQQENIKQMRADPKFKNTDAYKQTEKRITELYQQANPA